MNKKQQIEENMDQSFQENVMSCKELTENLNVLFSDWLDVLCSEWLPSLLLDYLTVRDITRLDTAICNRNGRTQWLKSLEKYFSSASQECFYWSNKFVEWIVARKLHFENLVIWKGFSRISNDNMYRLAQLCPDLKKLYMMYDGYEDDAKLLHFISFCNKLVSINLVRFKLSQDHCIGLGACEQLESISISHCRLLIFHVNDLLQNKPKLKTLELTDSCHGVVLLELGTNCPLLQHLYIYLEETTAMHIEVFTQGCPKLKTLEIVETWNVDDDDEDKDSPDDLRNGLIEGLGKNCPLLERLIIRSIPNSSDASEAALKYLAQGCPLLKQFHIRCFQIPSAGVRHLVGYCPKLADIYLSSSRVSDDVLVELGKSTSLTILYISDCYEITDGGIDALVKGCGSNLKRLDIRNCDQLTDASLSSISEHCPNLYSINLGNNHRDMTPAAIRRLFQQCEKLVEFPWLNGFIENSINKPGDVYFEYHAIRHMFNDRKQSLLNWTAEDDFSDFGDVGRYLFY